MTVPEETDCLVEREPRCPYCGETQSDFWEVTADDGDYECGHCSRKFMYSRYVDVTYTTRPIIGPHKLDQYTIATEIQDEE